MGITASWHNAEKTIIRLDYVSPWTWDEFLVATKESQNMALSLDYNVGIISTPSVPSPKGNPLPYFSQSIENLPSNIQIIAIVGSNYFITALTKMAVTVFSKYRNRLFIAYSLAEAEAAITDKLKQGLPVSQQ